jgi:DedD protein
VVLVLVAVVGFPLLVDKQPRPMAVDIAIDIPDKAKVKPLTLPASADTPAPAATTAVAAAPVAVVAPAAPAIAATPLVKPAPPPVAASAVAPVVAKVVDKAPEKMSDKAADKPKVVADKTDKADKAEAKTAVADEGRYVVQVGAFAEEARSRTARQKLERAGFKNYTQVADTKDGKRIRVRAGPFATKADADKAAEKIKKLGLPTSVLTL